MALDPSSLSSALAAVFASMPASAHAAANALAKAYDDYAAGGMFGASTPTLTGKKSALASTLEGGMAVPGAAATFAGAWASGIAAYWTAVPIVGAQAGTTAGCPGAASLTGSLTTVFANLANTPATCAAAMTTALDAATKTTTANVTPPPGTTLTIA